MKFQIGDIVRVKQSESIYIVTDIGPFSMPTFDMRVASIRDPARTYATHSSTMELATDGVDDELQDR